MIKPTVILIIAVIASTSTPESSQSGSHTTTTGCSFDQMDSENESESNKLPEIAIPPIFQNISEIILRIGTTQYLPVDKFLKSLIFKTRTYTIEQCPIKKNSAKFKLISPFRRNALITGRLGEV